MGWLRLSMQDIDIRSFGSGLESRALSARNYSTSELLRTL